MGYLFLNSSTIYFNFVLVDQIHDDNEQSKMSFLSHLEELRWRLVKSSIAIVLFAIVIFIYSDVITNLLFHSLQHKDFPTYRFFCWLSQSFNVSSNFCDEIVFEVINTKITGQFSFTMTLSIVGGIICAFPYLFFQIWQFIKPGLKKNEVKVTTGVIYFSTILFVLGVLFGYFIVAALTIQFFATFKISEDVKNTFTLDSFYGTVVWTSLMLGLFFQLPLVVYFLSKLEIINHLFLKKYRKF